jgi:hypothetical protein
MIGEESITVSGVLDGAWHHFVVTRENTLVTTVYMDGARIARSSSPRDSLSAYVAGTIRALTGSEAVTIMTVTAPTGPAWIGSLAIFDRALSETEAVTIYRAWLDRFPGSQSSSTRFGAALDAARFPAFRRSIETTAEVQTARTVPRGNLKEVLDRVARTEGGRWFVAGDGTVTFHDRDYGQDHQATATVAFSDQTDYRYASLSPVYRRDRIRTEVVVDTGQGVTVLARDLDAIDVYGLRREQADSVDLEIAASRLRAERILAARKEPVARIEGMRVLPGRVPEVLYPAVLALEIGDRISVTHTPEVGSAWTQEFFVEGYEWETDGVAWATDLVLEYAADIVPMSVLATPVAVPTPTVV